MPATLGRHADARVPAGSARGSRVSPGASTVSRPTASAFPQVPDRPKALHARTHRPHGNPLARLFCSHGAREGPTPGGRGVKVNGVSGPRVQGPVLPRAPQPPRQALASRPPQHHGLRSREPLQGLPHKAPSPGWSGKRACRPLPEQMKDWKGGVLPKLGTAGHS